MITVYLASFRSSEINPVFSIEKKEVVGITNLTVSFTGTDRTRRLSASHGYFTTKEDAVSFLLKQKKKEVERIKKEIDLSKLYIQKLVNDCPVTVVSANK